jgi:hypothetical protein
LNLHLPPLLTLSLNLLLPLLPHIEHLLPRRLALDLLLLPQHLPLILRSDWLAHGCSLTLYRRPPQRSLLSALLTH